jgi:hypothetical protein
MRSFVVEESLNNIVAPPISVPQVEIPALSPGLPICQFQLIGNNSISVPHLCLHFIGFRTLGFVERVNSGLPLLYAGLFYQTFNAGDGNFGSPILYVGLDAPGVATLRRNSMISFSAPGVYRMMLVNNHASSTIVALVTGTTQLLNV